MPFKILRTGNPQIDRIQQNVASALQELTSTDGAGVTKVTTSTIVQDATSYLLVTAGLADVVVKVPAGRTAPLTVVHAGGNHAVSINPQPENADGKLSAGGALVLLPSGDKLFAIGSYP